MDWKLSFDGHISDMCKKPSGKLNTLARIVPFIGFFQKTPLYNSLFRVSFSFLGRKMWDMLLDDRKDIKYSIIFNSKVKILKLEIVLTDSTLITVLFDSEKKAWNI